MTPTRTTLAFFSLLLAMAGMGINHVAAAPAAPQGWDQAPGHYSQFARQGFQDGQTGARRDADNHRRPDPNNREEYRNPGVPQQFWDEYREGFRRGYERAVAQIYGEGQPGNWRNAPGRYSEMQRRGFQDGMVGAQRDADNGRRPDPNNRDEYRSPNLPQQFWEEYQEGFRRGYEVEAERLYGHQAPPQAYQPPAYQPPVAQAPMAPTHWDAPPPAFSEAERQGFRDGKVGAQRDADNGRRPDPNNRDEYRSPNVPQQFWDEYRAGFRRGYELAVARMTGEFDENRWQNAPGRYDQYQRQGFQDGMVGAQRDADNHRRPDPNNRDEYRSPRIPPEAWEAYREGYRRGYEVQSARLYGGGGYR